MTADTTGFEWGNDLGGSISLAVGATDMEISVIVMHYSLRMACRWHDRGASIAAANFEHGGRRYPCLDFMCESVEVHKRTPPGIRHKPPDPHVDLAKL